MTVQKPPLAAGSGDAHDAAVTFARHLRRVLEQAGIGVRAFARDTGVNTGNLAAILAGKRKPSLQQIDAWADRLGLHGQKRQQLCVLGWLAIAPPQLGAYVAALRRERDAALRRAARAGNHPTKTRRAPRARTQPVTGVAG